MGSVGLIHITLSWTGLRSVPVRVTISDVYVVLSPAEDQHVDAAEVAAFLAKAKQDGLANWESLRFPEKDAAGDGAEGAASSSASASASGEEPESKGFLGRLIDTIVDHVTVTVSRVHVVFEGPHATLGVGIRSLLVSPCDEAWKKVTQCIDTTSCARCV